MTQQFVEDAVLEVERLRRQLSAVQRDLETHRAALRQELELAARVHRSLLPTPVRNGQIHIDLRYVPIEQVGGDYCQVGHPDRDTCVISIWDVTGHGIGPALLATRVSSEVRYGILYGRSPHEIVDSLNLFICDHFGDTGLYLSCTVAQIDFPRREITWCGAGHPSPLLIRRNGLIAEQLVSQNMLIGIREEFLDEHPEDTLRFEPGDRLLFYTDGLTETADAFGRPLGVDGLTGIAVEAMSVELFGMADRIFERITKFEHAETLDDKTLIVAEIR